MTFPLFFSQEVDKLLDVDFGFVTKQLTDDISDKQLQALVGDPLLKELDTVSVEPIKAVKELSKGEFCTTAKIGRGRRPSPIWNFLNPIISKLDKHVVLLLINYIATVVSYWALLSHRRYYTVARRYEFHVRVARTISHE